MWCLPSYDKVSRWWVFFSMGVGAISEKWGGRRSYVNDP